MEKLSFDKLIILHCLETKTNYSRQRFRWWRNSGRWLWEELRSKTNLRRFRQCKGACYANFSNYSDKIPIPYVTNYQQEEQAARGEREGASEESGGDSEDDGFIVDDEDRPLTDSRKRRKPIFADHTLQAAQDIFGVDFDYNDFEKYGDEYHEEEDDDYEDEGQLTSRYA